MTVQTIEPSVSSRVPGRSPVLHVGLQFKSSHESRDTTCSTGVKKPRLKDRNSTDDAKHKNKSKCSTYPLFYARGCRIYGAGLFYTFDAGCREHSTNPAPL